MKLIVSHLLLIWSFLQSTSYIAVAQSTETVEPARVVPALLSSRLEDLSRDSDRTIVLPLVDEDMVSRPVQDPLSTIADLERVDLGVPGAPLRLLSFGDQAVLSAARDPMEEIVQLIGAEVKWSLASWRDLGALLASLSEDQSGELRAARSHRDTIAVDGSDAEQVALIKSIASGSDVTVNGKTLGEMSPDLLRLRMNFLVKLYFIEPSGAFHEVTVTRTP